jgi:hypothetical protein
MPGPASWIRRHVNMPRAAPRLTREEAFARYSKVQCAPYSTDMARGGMARGEADDGAAVTLHFFRPFPVVSLMPQADLVLIEGPPGHILYASTKIE